MAAVANHTLRVNLLGFKKDGAKVIAQTQDGQNLKVRCACNKIYFETRKPVLRSRRPGRLLQCYECSCKVRQQGAIDSAKGRDRNKGMFAPKLETTRMSRQKLHWNILEFSEANPKPLCQKTTRNGEPVKATRAGLLVTCKRCLKLMSVKKEG